MLILLIRSKILFVELFVKNKPKLYFKFTTFQKEPFPDINISENEDISSSKRRKTNEVMYFLYSISKKIKRPRNKILHDRDNCSEPYLGTR